MLAAKESDQQLDKRENQFKIFAQSLELHFFDLIVLVGAESGPSLDDTVTELGLVQGLIVPEILGEIKVTGGSSEDAKYQSQCPHSHSTSFTLGYHCCERILLGLALPWPTVQTLSVGIDQYLRPSCSLGQCRHYQPFLQRAFSLIIITFILCSPVTAWVIVLIIKCYKYFHS